MEMFERIKFLKEKYNFEPCVIYDIGAHEGDWMSECLQIYPDAKYYLFEANKAKKDFIPQAIFEVLSSQDNQNVIFYKTSIECDTGNSVYRENTEYFDDDIVQMENRISRKLDSIVEERKLPKPDLVKIDTQGSELDIMKGGLESLKNAQVIILEVSLHYYNKNVPLLDEVILFMRKSGYIMFDIGDMHYKNDILIHIDAMFCNLDSIFITKRF